MKPILLAVFVLLFSPLSANTEESLTGTYQGVVTNKTAGLTASIELQLRDHNGYLTGCLGVNQPLAGSGPLRGEFDGRQVEFTAKSPMFVIEGVGIMRGRLLQGTYTVQVIDGTKQDGVWTATKISQHDILPAEFRFGDCPTTASLDKLKVGDGEYWLYTEYGSSYLLDKNYQYAGVRTFNNENGDPVLMVVDQANTSTYYDGNGNYLKWISVQTEEGQLFVYDTEPYFYIYDGNLNFTDWYGAVGEHGEVTFAKKEGNLTLYYDHSLNFLNLYSFPLDSGDMVFGRISDGLTCYYDSQLNPLGLYSFNYNGQLLYGKVSSNRIRYYDRSFRPLYQYDYSLPSTDYTTLNDGFGNTISGSSMTFGDITFHSFSDSFGQYPTGTTISIGSTAFHNLYSSYGDLLSGTSMRIGNNTFTNLYGNFSNLSGTSMDVGNTTFHNVVGPSGVTTGTSMGFGNIIYHNFSGPSGTTTGATIDFGNTTFSHYFWTR